MKYFESKIKGKKGLPWTDSRTSWEKSSDEYFEKLESFAEDIDNIESSTAFISDLMPEDFDNGYQYVYGRINELHHYLKNEAVIENKRELMDALNEIHDELLDLEDDAILYEDYFDEDSEVEEQDDYIDEAFDDYDDSWDSDEDSDNDDDYEW